MGKVFDKFGKRFKASDEGDGIKMTTVQFSDGRKLILDSRYADAIYVGVKTIEKDGGGIILVNKWVANSDQTLVMLNDIVRKMGICIRRGQNFYLDLKVQKKEKGDNVVELQSKATPITDATEKSETAAEEVKPEEPQPPQS